VRKAQGIGKIMETLDNVGIKLFVLAALKEHQLYLLLYFICVSLVLVSMHERLCLVTVLVKVLQNGRLGQIFREVQRLAAASVTETANFTGASRTAVSKVMTAYTNRGKTPSATRNSGRKPIIRKRDHCN
jgi:hypothetical protein